MPKTPPPREPTAIEIQFVDNHQRLGLNEYLLTTLQRARTDLLLQHDQLTLTDPCPFCRTPQPPPSPPPAA